MTVVLTRVGYNISDSGMRVPRHHIPEQSFSRDESGVLSFIKLYLDFCGGELMDCMARSPVAYHGVP